MGPAHGHAAIHIGIVCLEGVHVEAAVQSMDEMLITIDSTKIVLPASAAKLLIKEAQNAYHQMSRLSELADPLPQL